MNKAFNIKEFKNLINKYDSITEEDLCDAEENLIEEGNYDIDPYHSLSEITGFNDPDKCSLCNIGEKKIDEDIYDCYPCVYKIATGSKCFQGVNGLTFRKLETSKNMEELLYNIKERSKHMKEILKNYEQGRTEEEAQ